MTSTKVTTVYKSHAEWLAPRNKHIGASEVPTILGISPYDTPYKLWLRKTGQVTEPEGDNFLMRVGYYLEDGVARLCADEMGLDIIRSSAAEFTVHDKDKPYFVVSPDRYCWQKGKKRTAANKVILECKTTQNPVEDLPQYWFVQVMAQLGVCGIDQGVITWLVRGGIDFGFRWIDFDATLFKEVIEAEVERFWTDNILGGNEPALSDIGDVIHKYPASVAGKTMEATPALLEKWGELRETNAEIKRLKANKEAIEAYIKQQMADNEAIVCDNKPLFTWKSGQASRKFNEAALRENHGQLYEEYLIEKPGARIFLTK